MITKTLSLAQQQQLSAGFAALAICIHLFESVLPNIAGIKPGLANIITLIVLLRYGLLMAINVQLLRVFIASLLNGTLFTPTFFLSLSGSFLALVVLAATYMCLRSRLRNPRNDNRVNGRPWQPSAISFSVLAAMAHMLGQFLLAYYWLIPHVGLFKLLPILLLIALAFGWVNGIIVQRVLQTLESQNNTYYA